MSVEEFNAEASKWLETAKHPRWNRGATNEFASKRELMS